MRLEPKRKYYVKPANNQKCLNCFSIEIGSKNEVTFVSFVFFSFACQTKVPDNIQDLLLINIVFENQSWATSALKVLRIL